MSGQPLTGGTIRFIPADRKIAKPGHAKVQADGSYKATTMAPDDGLMPGDYTIILESPETTEVAAKESGGGVNIPTKYQAPGTSGLTLNVAGATTSADFTLVP